MQFQPNVDRAGTVLRVEGDVGIAQEFPDFFERATYAEPDILCLRHIWEVKRFTGTMPGVSIPRGAAHA